MARRLSSLLLLVLCLVIGSPLLGAQSSTRKEIQRAPDRTQTTAAVDRLSQLWQHLTALWGAEGCGLDPNGAHCSATSTGSTGRLVVSQPPPEGCGLDPDGCR